MDRTRAHKHLYFAAMSPVKCVACQRVLHTKSERIRRELDTDARAGRALSQTPVLWCAAYDDVVEVGRIPRQYQTHHTTDAHYGTASNHARPSYKQSASRTQNIPVFIARYRCLLIKCGMVFGHHLHPDGARIHVFGGGDGLVQSLRNRVGIVQHTRNRFLPSRLKDCFGMWETKDFQHRPGQSIHQRRVDKNTAGCRRYNQHGWAWPLLRQHLHRASLAQREIRRYLLAFIPKRTRFISRIICVFSLLQSRTPAHKSGFTNTSTMLCDKLKEGRYFRDFSASFRFDLALRAFRLQRKRSTLHEAEKYLAQQFVLKERRDYNDLISYTLSAVLVHLILPCDLSKDGGRLSRTVLARVPSLCLYRVRSN